MEKKSELLFLLLINLIFPSCLNHNSSTLNNRRIDLIYEVINSLKIADIESVTKMVDTAVIFKVNGIEGYFGRINRANKLLNICPDFLANDIEITSPVNRIIEYRVKFCRGPQNEVSENSFDLIFTFYDYERRNIINSFEIKVYSHSKIPIMLPD